MFAFKIDICRMKMKIELNSYILQLKLGIYGYRSGITTEQVSYSNYLGNNIGYGSRRDIYIIEIGKFYMVCGTIHTAFKNKIRRNTIKISVM